MNKTILLTILISVGLLNSCKNKDEHGCLDYTATYYNDNAQIDNNSCCYTCYTVFNTPVDTIGSYCGREILELEENGFTYENIHVGALWVSIPYQELQVPSHIIIVLANPF